MPAPIRPVADDLTRPFWDGAREGRLRLQRCQDCGRLNHPPQSVCGYCSSADLHQDEVPGTGRIASWTSALRRREQTGSDDHICLVVELDAQPGVYLVSRVDGPRPDWVTIGTPVSVRFEALTGTDIVLPQFVAEDA